MTSLINSVSKVSITAMSGRTNNLYNNKMVMVNGYQNGVLGNPTSLSEKLVFISKCPTSIKFDGMEFESAKACKDFFKNL